MIGRIADTPFMALVRREFLVNLRTARAFLLVAVAVALCIIPTAAMFPEDMSDARNSDEILFLLLGILFTASALIVPGISAAAISVEREAETFDLLMMSTVKPTGVLAAKFLNAVGFFLLVVVAVLPVASTVMFLAGIEVRTLVMAALTLVVYTMSLACHGLLCSVVFRRTFTAMMASYVSMVLVSGGAFFIWMVVIGFFTGSSYYAFGFQGRTVVDTMTELVLPIVVPFAPIFEDSYVRTLQNLSESIAYSLNLPAADISYFLAAVPLLYQLGIAWVAFIVARRYLPRDVHPRAEVKTKIIDDAGELDRRRKSFPFYLIDPAKRKKQIEDGRNPVMVKEIRWGALSNLTAYIRVFYLTFLLFGCVNSLMWIGGSVADFEQFMLMNFAMQTAVACLIAPALMANTLTKEIETGNLDLLRSTLLRPNAIVRGKWIACVVAALPVTCSAILCNAPFMVSPILIQDCGDIMLMGTILLIATPLYVMNIAFFTSSFAKSTAMAVVMGYAAGLTLMVVLPVLSTIIILASVRGVDEEILLFTSFASPPFAFVASAYEFRVEQWYREEDASLVKFVAYFVANMSYVIIFSFILFAATQRRFARRMAQGEL